MCGIAGILSFSKQVSKDTIKIMTDSLVHRGPDGEGFFIDKKISLGHRRLSIIDLSDNASQPMSFDNLIITFNGEIYNYIELRKELEGKSYSFDTESDTEVLLKAFHCYGAEVLQKLDGMFAFAIWDKQKNELFCARDRFGEKPLYYYLDKEQFVFASEMKAIFATGVKKELNNNMIFHYLSFDLVENPNDKTETFYKKINKLEASTFLTINIKSKKIQKTKYWEIKTDKLDTSLTFNQAQTKFYELFYTSVKRRLRSDVKVGTSLSGGLDSSSVATLINKILSQTKQSKRQNTFSARFYDKKLDEGKFITEMVESYNFNHHEVFVTDEIMLDNFSKILYHQEEPFGSASIVAQWAVMELAKKNNTIVLLDGQGADEILAGYHKYFESYLKEMYLNDKELFFKQKQKIQNSHNYILNTDVKFILETKYPIAKKILTKLKHNIFRIKDFNGINKSFAKVYFEKIPFENFNNLNKSLKYDTQIYGLEKLLRFADRNAMAHSVETRLPFLSHDLVEFLFKLPAEYKINDIWTKYILRKSMENDLPEKIVWRIDKMGYQAPQNTWLNNNKTIVEKINEHKLSLINKHFITENFNDKWKIFMLGEFLQ